MEENKVKTIKMENQNGNSKNQQKLTYDQLNDVCNQLWQQNKQLLMKNKELEQCVMNKRIEYLFKTLELSNYFSEQFIVDCAREIEEALVIPDSLKEDISENNNIEEKKVQ